MTAADNAVAAVTSSTTESVAVGFDYGIVPPDVANKARAVAGRIRSYVRRMHDAALDAGRDLLAIKEQIESGHFVAWVENECDLNIRTAQRMMKAAAFVVERGDKLSCVAMDGLLALAAPNTPEDVRVEIIGRIEAGAVPSAKDIKMEITQAQQQRRDARDAEREAAMTPEEKKQAARRASDRKRRAAQQQREADELKQQIADCEAAGEAAARLLLECVGPRLGELLALAERAAWREIVRRLSRCRVAEARS